MYCTGESMLEDKREIIIKPRMSRSVVNLGMLYNPAVRAGTYACS